MTVIDFHTHIYPEKISDKAVKSVGDFYNIEMNEDGTANSLIEKGKANGISGYVVCSVAIDGNHVEAINNYISSECNAHSEFHGLAATHLEYPDKIGEMERAVQMGLKGVKIHPDTQKFYIDDKGMYELYDYLQEKELPILIHTGDYRYDFSHPRRLKKVLTDFPKLKAVAAHFGGWSLYDLALEYLLDTNCYVDTSSAITYLGTKRAEELINLYGAERVLFGTDFPMWSADGELAHFEKMNLSESQLELIMHKNAERLLKLV